MLANLLGYAKNMPEVAMVRLCNFTRRQAEKLDAYSLRCCQKPKSAEV